MLSKLYNVKLERLQHTHDLVANRLQSGCQKTRPVLVTRASTSVVLRSNALCVCCMHGMQVVLLQQHLCRPFAG
jgi:hypothetical protein